MSAWRVILSRMQPNDAHEALLAISPVDGRYAIQAEPLRACCSEYGLLRYRVIVECEYVLALAEHGAAGTRALSSEEIDRIRAIGKQFSLEDARIIKTIERQGWRDIPATNHDVKAVEYFVRGKVRNTSAADLEESVHFALTSEDVNSVAYALMLRSALEEVVLPALTDLGKMLDVLSREQAKTPMLARTHGQPATPTTFGKEMRVFERRLAHQLEGFATTPIMAKCSGATGNHNAHVVADPLVDWRAFSRAFIERFNTEFSITIELNEVTTQIEPHDSFAECFDRLRRVCMILTDFSQDMWRYISDGWLMQRAKQGEVGSSTMPHKVNPIDFENAEGNLGVAAALCNHFSMKLPVSRLQRDLSDSTVERSIGTALAHVLIAAKALQKGLGKIDVHEDAMRQALSAHPEVLAEAVQSVLRAEGKQQAYEKLKELTRGKAVTLEDVHRAIEELPLSEEGKRRLRTLTPETYIGLAEDLASRPEVEL